MEDAFGDPNIIDDVKESLSGNATLPLESDNKSGIPWEDYCDTDYNEIEKEPQEEYGNSPSFYEIHHDDQETSPNLSSNDNEKVDHWAGAKLLLTPVHFIVNFAATQLTSLKSAVSSHGDTSHTKPDEEAPELGEDGSDSLKKIMTSLSSEKSTTHEKPFTSQDEILDEVGASPNEEGICSPMVNLYFEEQLGYRDRSFREGSAKHIYQEALKEKQHQIDLIHQGKDGLHAVFVDHNLPYEKKVVKASESEREEAIEALLKDYDQALITYPVVHKDGEKDRHQIYVQRISETECSRFDVNKQGGIDKMPCKMFYHKLAHKVAKTHDDKDDEAEVIVAGIKEMR